MMNGTWALGAVLVGLSACAIDVSGGRGNAQMPVTDPEAEPPVDSKPNVAPPDPGAPTRLTAEGARAAKALRGVWKVQGSRKAWDSVFIDDGYATNEVLGRGRQLYNFDDFVSGGYYRVSDSGDRVFHYSYSLPSGRKEGTQAAYTSSQLAVSETALNLSPVYRNEAYSRVNADPGPTFDASPTRMGWPGYEP
jgi:hypothetical protein